jgi:uncharacterized protein (TIGR00251 family)
MLREDTDAVLLAVRVKPRAARERIAGERAGRLLVEVNAPPVEGRANEAVCKVIARALGVAPGRVAVIGGERGRDKLLKIDGVSFDHASRALRGA